MLYCCQFSFLAFITAFLFEWVFAFTSKRQGRSCHIVTNSSSRSSSQKSAIFARDRPHDLFRHMTRPIYMLLSHWPNYLQRFRRVVRLSALIWRVPTSTDGVQLRSNMLSLHDGLRADGKRLNRSRGSVRTPPTTTDETSSCVASWAVVAVRTKLKGWVTRAEQPRVLLADLYTGPGLGTGQGGRATLARPSRWQPSCDSVLTFRTSDLILSSCIILSNMSCT